MEERSYREEWNYNRRHVSLPSGMWDKIRQCLLYLQEHGMVQETMTSFWARASENELSSTMNHYGLTDAMISEVDPEGSLKVGRPPEAL